MPIKVALLSSDIDPRAGWGNITHELCSALTKREDISFDVYVPYNAHVEPGISYSLHVHRILPQWIGTFRHSWHRILEYMHPLKLVNQPDIIHSIVEFPYAITARATARKLRIPYALTTQGTYAIRPFLHIPDRWFQKPAFRDAAFLVAPSRFTRSGIIKSGGMNLDIRIIHNAVNYQRFQKEVGIKAVLDKYSLPNNNPIILGIGGLKPRKGFDTLLRAFAIIMKQIPEAHLVIAGEGFLRKHLEQLARELEVVANFHLPGNIVGDELVGLLQACTVYAHFPVNDNWNFEGFGIVYLEAGSCGKPVVGTRSGGVPDAIKDGATGYLVDEYNHAAAAEAIKRLLMEETVQRAMGEAGREYASKNTWERYSQSLVELWHNAIKKYGKGSI